MKKFLKLTKTKYLASITMFVVFAYSIMVGRFAYAIDLSDRFYIKSSLYLESAVNNYHADSLSSAIDYDVYIRDHEKLYRWLKSRNHPQLEDYKNISDKKYSFSPKVGIQAIFFTKVNNFFHPFVGLDFAFNFAEHHFQQEYQATQGELFIYFRQVAENTFTYRSLILDFKSIIDFKEILKANFMIGTKMNITKNFAISVYGLIGMNYAKFYSHTEKTNILNNITVFDVIYNANDLFPSQSKKTKNIGVIYGAGLNFIIRDIFMLGFEYSISKNIHKPAVVPALNHEAIHDQEGNYFEPLYLYNQGSVAVKIHKFAVKIGMMFL